jgi:hypothetical protein
MLVRFDLRSPLALPAGHQSAACPQRGRGGQR